MKKWKQEFMKYLPTDFNGNKRTDWELDGKPALAIIIIFTITIIFVFISYDTRTYSSHSHYHPQWPTDCQH